MRMLRRREQIICLTRSLIRIENPIIFPIYIYEYETQYLYLLDLFCTYVNNAS